MNTQETFDDPRVVSIDADGISAAILGRVILNTVLRLRDAELRSLEDEIGWGVRARSSPQRIPVQ